MKKKIIFFGNKGWGIYVLDYLISRGYEIPLVILPPGINKERAMGISELLPSSTIIIKYHSDNEKVIADVIKSFKDYLILACSYTSIIPKSIVELGVVNIHGAILPQHRGSNMLNWAIINGSKETGITLHYMEETLDSGSIIANITYPIYSCENVNDVKMTMFAKTIELLDKNLPALMGGKVKGSEQDHTLARYYPKRKPEDGRIDWSKNAEDIYNLIRALVSPYPGAFTNYTSSIVIKKVRIEIDNKPHFYPGKIIKHENGVWVTAGYNIIVIEEIREGSLRELYNFLPIGEHLE